jgi:predicted RNA-binding Zn ribbon-like protein
VPFTIESHEFAARDFIGGDAALDFINTVTGRDESPRDWLDSYARLLDWATVVRLLPERNLRALTRKMHSEPAAAARALTRAKALREELFALVSAMVSGNSPPKNALAALREHWLIGTEAHDLRFENGRVVADVRADAADFDLVAAMIAYRMVEHVMPQPVDRLRMCSGSNCAWVFIDSSKAGRRRWCDMAVCGNVAKAQRFYARSRKRS